MLQTIRDRIQGPVIIGVLLFLALIFVVWGIGTRAFVGESSDPTVAEVGGAKITQTQYRREYDKEYQELVQSQGPDFRPDSVDTAKLRQQVLDRLVREQVMLQYAKKMGYRVTDADVFDYISQMPALQKDGQFSVDTYHALLQAQGRSAESFESQLRQGLTARQLPSVIDATAFVTPRQLQADWRLGHQLRSYRAVHIDPAAAPGAEVTSNDVQKYYDAHKDDFKIPQRTRVAYVELSPDKLPAAADPGATALKELYDKQVKGGAFTTPEERHSAHILIKFGADKAAAQKRAESVVIQLKGGGDFAALAKQYSDDSSSKDKGGDLGWNPRKTFNPEMEQALFSLKAGEVSSPVETMAGWDVIKVLDIRPELHQPFEDAQVQKSLLESYREMDAGKRFQEAREKISDLAFENPTSLEPLAKALGLAVQTSDWFSAQGGGRGIAANADVVKAAFAPDVLQDGDNSKPISLGPKDLVVVRKLEVTAPRVPALSEVADAIRTKLRGEHARDAALAKARQVIDAVKAGRALDDAAATAHLVASAARTVQRSELADNAKLGDALFGLAPPEAQKPALAQAIAADGSVDVVQLVSVGDGQMPAPASTEGKTEASALRERLAIAAFESYRTLMQQRVGVKQQSLPADAGGASPLE